MTLSLISQVAMISVAWVTTTLPCNIPVFRYALERWPSDDYQLVVYHKGHLPEKAETDLRKIESSVAASKAQNAAGESKLCNLAVVRIDVNGSANVSTEARIQELLKQWKSERSQQSLEKPFVELRTAPISGRSLVVWSGDLSAWDSGVMLASPVRSQLCQNLMRGDAVVWLMIRSKDEVKNAAARKVLVEKNKELSQQIELPDGVGLPGSELFSEVPLLLDFTIAEVARDDAKEHFLLSLFQRFDADAFESDEPLFIPVFGRGRALEVIPASRLDAGMIGDLTAFLCGACSCQVKERNPGFDLLITMPWQEKLFGAGPYPPPPDIGLGSRSQELKMRQIPSGKSVK